MGGDIWRSREAELVSKYAQRLEPDDLDENGAKKPIQLTPISKDAKDDELELSYINGAPPPDLLNYKNMDLEMSLWAKTGTGWMSLGVLVIFTFACVILSIMMWIFHIGA